MSVLYKISYRNLREHKTKTLIVGLIIAFGVFILVIGNSLLDTASKGVRKSYTENYTGDIILTSVKQKSPGLFISDRGMSIDEPVPVIRNYPELLKIVESDPSVRQVTPLLSGFATAQIGESGSAFLQLWGVDPELYNLMFPGNMELIQGDFLKPGQNGIVISQNTIESIEESSGKTPGVGDTMLISSMNAVSGTKIREVTIRGVYSFINSSPQLQLISFVDPGTMRVLNGMTQVQDIKASLTKEEQSILGAVNEDDLFSSDSDLLTTIEPAAAQTPVAEDALLSILGDTSARDVYNEIDPNSWQFLLVKVDKGAAADRVIRQMNDLFQKDGVEVKAFNWLEGAGGMAQITFTFKTIFNILILLVAVVSIIIIMNTLVISVTERIGEIGTMRAIGAQRSFVRRMILLETSMISVVFGLIGIVAGSIAVSVLGAIGLKAGNMFLQVLFGGPVLRPGISPASIVLSIAVVVAVGIISSLYPVSVALRIQPVKAMNQTS
ncbi:MAG: ABC transporter permease [Spirochaetales bacterium]|nr:MAG: ABC transporter permease [Spirochaetales bacterium]